MEDSKVNIIKYFSLKWDKALIFPILLIYLLCFIIPLIHLFNYGIVEITEIIQGNSMVPVQLYWKVYLKTISICAISTLLTLIISIPFSLTIVYGKGILKKISSISLLIPLLTNPLILIIGWLIVLRNDGIIYKILSNFGISQILYTPVAVIIGIIYIGFPLMVFPIVNSMKSIDIKIINASYSLGAGDYNVFKRIILPLSLGGIIIGTVIVFTTSLGYFIIPILLGGGKVSFISVLIEQQINETLNWPLVSFLSILMVLTIGAITLFGFIAFRYFNKKDIK